MPHATGHLMPRRSLTLVLVLVLALVPILAELSSTT
jgi:hypothetical protein